MLLISIASAIISFGIFNWTKKPWIPYFFILVVLNGISAIYEVIVKGYISGWWVLAHLYFNGYLLFGVCIAHFAWYGYSSKSRNDDND